MVQYQLSICIPTFNRSKMLAGCLSGLIGQIRPELTNDVQICVSNNASEDDTEALVTRLKSENPDICIKYQCQKYNKGFASNFFDVVGMADGEYVFVCGDDDQFTEGSIKEMLSSTHSGATTVVYSSLPGNGSYFREKQADSKTQPVCLENVDHVNRMLGIFHLSFIGNTMIKRRAFIDSIDPQLTYSAYPHVGVLIRAIGAHGGIFVDRPILVVDDSAREWRAHQPRYTSVDMARIQTEFFLKSEKKAGAAAFVYRRLVCSIPRAILNQRLGIIPKPVDPKNAAIAATYSSLGLGNILDCYRYSRKYQLLAMVYWVIAHLLPIRVLKKLLKQA